MKTRERTSTPPCIYIVIRVATLEMSERSGNPSTLTQVTRTKTASEKKKKRDHQSSVCTEVVEEIKRRKTLEATAGAYCVCLSRSDLRPCCRSMAWGRSPIQREQGFGHGHPLHRSRRAAGSGLGRCSFLGGKSAGDRTSQMSCIGVVSFCFIVFTYVTLLYSGHCMCHLVLRG